MGQKNYRNYNGLGLAAAISSLAILATIPCASAQISDPTLLAQATVDIPAGPLVDAIHAVSEAYGTAVLAPDDLLRGKRASAVGGALNAADALDQLIYGTGLEVRSVGDGSFILIQQVAQIAPIVRDTENEARASQTTDTDTLVVTGSRIGRTAVNSPSPIDIVTADEIERLGLNDTTEALRFVPALQQSTSLTTQPTFGFIGPTLYGLGTLDLRGLGENRTLVLVNGRRHVGGVANEATVDVTSIPAALIDRVEVLTGGGSSIYGADAVSGVVNYILKDDFEGVEFSANGSLPTRGDAEAFTTALTMGGNFSEGRGNAVVSLEYNRQTELEARDRRGTRSESVVVQNTPEISSALGINPNFRNVLLPDQRLALLANGALINFSGSVFDPLDAFAAGITEIGGVPVSQIVDPVTGEIRPQVVGPFINGISTQGGDGVPQFLSNPRTTIIPESERYVLNAFADYDFTDQMTGFVEAKYSRNESSASTSQGLSGLGIPIQSDNPFIPDQIQAQFDSLTTQSLDPNLVVTRSFWDDIVNDRPTDNIRETFRLVGGFEGIVSKALSYEISANYGRTDTSIVNNAEGLPDRFYAAADAIADPATGQPICRSDIDTATLPALGLAPGVTAPGFRSFVPGSGACSPLNIFAPLNQLNPETVDFIFQRTEVEFELEQIVFNATLTGNSEDFFALPSGGIGYAAGVEYREETSERRPDPLDLAGLAFNSANAEAFIVGGAFDVWEGFAEINVPVLSNLPLVEGLAVDASVRIADYSTIGTATSFAYGAVWQPTRDLRVRASFNRAIRAPNISELFTPQQGLRSELEPGTDPCDPNGVTNGSSTRAQNCALLVPDPENFDPTPSYAFGNIIETRGGNPDLTEETADTISVGLAYTPSSVQGLSLVADYYSIEISDAVSGFIGRSTLVQNCADAPTIDNAFCEAITRNPMTGVVEQIQVTALNVAASIARGIDYEIVYAFDVDDLVAANLGDFTVGLSGNYLIKREDQIFAGFPETDVRLDRGIPFPKHFINASLAWQRGAWSADYGLNYQSNQLFATEPFTPDDIEADPFLLDRPNTGDAFIHYIGGAYQLNDAVQFSVRVNNLTDEDPFELRGFGNSFRPVSFLGRTVQLGVEAKF